MIFLQKYLYLFTVFAIAGFLVLGGASAIAQDSIEVDVKVSNAEDDSRADDKDNMPVFEPIKKTFDLSTIPSLFFTYWQHQSIQGAKSDRLRNGVVRPPSQAELDAIERGDIYESDIVYIREVALGGIVYNSDTDWTIWLNEQRVTPNAIPKEVLGLKVYKDFIELKWIDEKTNNVFPIRLRSHQRFNLDARIFLTGE